MSLVEKATSFVTGGGRACEPVGAVRVVDQSPLNWLYIIVAALEQASGKCAISVGKPERAYFELVLKDLGLPAEMVAMVGDDP